MVKLLGRKGEGGCYGGGSELGGAATVRTMGEMKRGDWSRE